MAAITQTGEFRQSNDVSGSGGVLRYFWSQNRTMTVFFLLSAASLLVALVGMVIDPRMVLGQSTWTKTAKFSISFLFYAPTMIWMFSHLDRPRIKAFILHGTAAILIMELAALVIQASRGQAMHFNVSSPFNAALWSFMAVTIMIFYVISIIGGAVLVTQKLRDPVTSWSLRLGMLLMLIGFGLGYLMTGPSPDQLTELQAGNSVPMIGAHTVGAADGGPGLTFLGWSTEHGDLRIAHFVGIHGAQFMLLAGWLVMVMGSRLGLSTGRRLALVWGAAGSYLGLVALVTWQALRGEPLIAPSALTLMVAASLLAVTALYNGVILGSAWRAQSHKL